MGNESTDSRERAVEDESTEVIERAGSCESTGGAERAETADGTDCAERATVGESTVKPERAEEWESTELPERAGADESTKVQERAVRGESTETSERAVRGESTDPGERVLRHYRFSGINESPPGGNRGATVTLAFGRRADRDKGKCNPVIAKSSPAVNSGAVRMAYPSIFAIQIAVAQRCGVSTLDLISDRRGRAFSRPRQLVCWLAARLTLLSMRDIGRALRRDHTTVCQAVARAEELLRTDPEFAWAAVSLRYQLTPRERVA